MGTKYGTGLEYNESLKKRGNLSLWISEDAIKKWKVAKDPRFLILQLWQNGPKSLGPCSNVYLSVNLWILFWTLPALKYMGKGSGIGVNGDGAYDTAAMKRLIEEHAKLLAPPKSGAVVNETDKASEMERNESILQIIGLGNDDEAIKLWKRLTGYHKRSLVETTFSRLKGTFGGKFFSKDTDNQKLSCY